MSLTTEAEKKEFDLTLNDRCDSCSAQAFVSVTGLNGELMFCAHHYNKIMDSPTGNSAMKSFALETVDERDKLSVKSTVYL
jgi:predicted metalloprotease with PDZ domain